MKRIAFLLFFAALPAVWITGHLRAEHYNGSIKPGVTVRSHSGLATSKNCQTMYILNTGN